MGKARGIALVAALGLLVGCGDGGDPPTDGGAARDGGAGDADGGGVDGGGADGGMGGDASTGGLTPRNAREVVIGGAHHPLGVPLVAVLDLPDGASAAAPVPACVVLHGSGGLFREGPYGEPCTDAVEANFEGLLALLAEEGVAALAPSSFYSRDPRFCEDDSEYIDFAPAGYDRDAHRIALRTYDLLASARFLCARDDVDCDRLCVVGTSNGGSILFHYVHHALESSFETFFADHAADIGDVPYVAIPSDRPRFRVAHAISPGCGLNGAIGLEGDAADLPDEPIAQLYYPDPATALHLELGTDDAVPDECALAVGDGRRELQADEVERRQSIAPADSRYGFTIHEGGPHDLLGTAPYGDTVRAAFRARVRGL